MIADRDLRKLLQSDQCFGDQSAILSSSRLCTIEDNLESENDTAETCYDREGRQRMIEVDY